MSTATIDGARTLVRRLEQRERSKTGSLASAREALARRIGVAPTTWRNLALGRIKRLDAWMRDRLQGLLIKELETELAHLTHELEIARQCGNSPDCQHVSEIQAHLTKATQLLRGN